MLGKDGFMYFHILSGTILGTQANKIVIWVLDVNYIYMHYCLIMNVDNRIYFLFIN